MTIVGEKIKLGAKVTIKDVEPKSLKFKSADSNGDFTRVTAKGRVCGNIPGDIVITNPPVGGVNAPASNKFNCTERCPTS